MCSKRIGSSIMERRNSVPDPKPESLEDMEVTARRLAPQIAKQMPKGWGFSLITFTMNTPPGQGKISYISNCQREDMVKALRELLAKWERKEKEL